MRSQWYRSVKMNKLDYDCENRESEETQQHRENRKWALREGSTLSLLIGLRNVTKKPWFMCGDIKDWNMQRTFYSITFSL